MMKTNDIEDFEDVLRKYLIDNELSEKDIGYEIDGWYPIMLNYEEVIYADLGIVYLITLSEGGEEVEEFEVKLTELLTWMIIR